MALPFHRPRVAPLLGAGLTLALLVLPTPRAHSTILLFDQERDAATQSIVGPTSSGGRVPLDYGDNVTGPRMAVPGGFFTYGEAGEGFTPDITLEIFSASATPTDPRVALWQRDYGDLVNVIFAEGPGVGGSPELNIRFSAAPGYSALLYGFELAGWSNADYVIAGVRVLAGATTLFTESDVLVEGNSSGPRHTTFAFATPLSGAELLLQLDLSNLATSLQDNVGIDSIRFGQSPPAVPEPATGILLLCGLTLTAAVERRLREGPA